MARDVEGGEDERRSALKTSDLPLLPLPPLPARGRWEARRRRGHWVKLFLMNTLGKRPESSWTTRMSIWEQKETSRRRSRGQAWRSFFSEAALTSRVPERYTDTQRQ
ncbi:hypothetical protein EYF80_045067 [Liparis tanakae]|uniref:Uncharacterized protein n=1 Tax=Liparis tanakae TaxID=230148 RepID=A0A4Z2FTX5_9TELE|nr:hypothetical protein EYF80_045067 [Liparis tanakae]